MWFKDNCVKQILLFPLLVLSLTACQTQPIPTHWHWERAEAGLSRQAALVLSVAVDPGDPNRLWAGYYAAGGLATSLDGGQTWDTRAIGLADNPVFEVLPVPLSAENEAPLKLWAATRDGLQLSLDRGDSWQLMTGLPPVAAFSLANDAQGQTFVGLDGAGVFVKANTGQWRTLALEEAPLASAAVISLAVSPEGQHLYAGTSGQGVFASQDGGQTWVVTYPNSYVPNVAVNPLNPNLALASLRERVVRTFDGGRSWHTLASLSIPANEVTSLLWLPDGRLVAGTSQGLFYASLDSGDSWVQGGNGLPPGGILGLAVASHSDGPPQLLGATWNGLYASQDQGQSWHNLVPDLGIIDAQALLKTEQGLFLGTGTGLYRWEASTQQWLATTQTLSLGGVQSLAGDPTDSQTLYAGTSGSGLYRSQDGGMTWHALSAIGVGISALAVDPVQTSHLYMLAAWERVYESYNAGQSWQANWQGLGDTLETVSLLVTHDNRVESIVYVGGRDRVIS